MEKRVKIVVDDKIPYISGALEPFAEVVYLPGGKISRADLMDADALITRTRTQCDEELLSGTPVKFIATATIGYDHIDTHYCESAGIKWTNAPGCNSGSVDQYVASALVLLAKEKNLKLSAMTIGVVGVGNVGKKVAKTASLLGMRVLLNDPPRARAEGEQGFVPLSKIEEQADVITLHVPLNLEGEDATWQMADADFFGSLKKCPIFINSCRGEVVHGEALKAAMKNRQLSGVVIDCWENEPDIDPELLELVDLATPHIAGYSRDGKAKGTAMSVMAMSRFFGFGLKNWQPKGVEKDGSMEIVLDGTGKEMQQILTEVILATYNIRNDDQRLRSSPQTFEKQRGDYPVRREFKNWTIYCRINNLKIIEKLQMLGFKM